MQTLATSPCHALGVCTVWMCPFIVILCGWKQGHTHSTDYFLSLRPVLSPSVTWSVNKHLLDLCKRQKCIFNSLETQSPAHLSVYSEPECNQDPTLQHLSWAREKCRDVPRSLWGTIPPGFLVFERCKQKQTQEFRFFLELLRRLGRWQLTPWEPPPSLVWRETSCQKHPLPLGSSWIHHL